MGRRPYKLAEFVPGYDLRDIYTAIELLSDGEKSLILRYEADPKSLSDHERADHRNAIDKLRRRVTRDFKESEKEPKPKSKYAGFTQSIRSSETAGPSVKTSFLPSPFGPPEAFKGISENFEEKEALAIIMWFNFCNQQSPSVRQISQILNIPEDTVRSVMCSALKQYKAVLMKGFDETISEIDNGGIDRLDDVLDDAVKELLR